MSKLIVLITNSDFDLGQIASRVKKDITYIDCDTGEWDPELTKCENLLAIIELHPSREKTANNAITDDDKQHNNICFTKVLKECHNYQTVTGVHGISPDKVLAISQFPNVPVTHYSTGRQQFQFITSWFKKLILENSNSEKIKQDFLALFELFNKSPIDKLFIRKRYLLHLFLPLDIDMQALKATENQEGYLNNMRTDLDEPYKSGKYKDGKIDEHYRQKLYDLWFLLKPSEENKERASPEGIKLTPINNPHDDLLKLAGLGNGISEESPIYKFLESLDERKTKAINYLLEPFESSDLKECDGKEINSFHDWYCALASCLRGVEASK